MSYLISVAQPGYKKVYFSVGGGYTTLLSLAKSYPTSCGANKDVAEYGKVEWSDV